MCICVCFSARVLLSFRCISTLGFPKQFLHSRETQVEGWFCLEKHALQPILMRTRVARVLRRPYHPTFFWDFSSVTVPRSRSHILDNACCVYMDSVVCVCVCVCVCDGGWWQWQWEVPPVASFCCLTVCVRVFVHVTEQKVTGLTFVVAHESLRRSIPQVKHRRETLISTYTTQQEINTFTPPRCSPLLSLPRLMRELLLLAEGLLLTPSRSQMIVFAAWGPDPTSPDPVTGTVEPFHRVPAESWT